MELIEAMDRDIRPILDAIDNIRPYVKRIDDIAQMLPAIVVVGDQSSGKSSLLEALSGVELPRGAGICTRVPLELQLRSGDAFHARLEYQKKPGAEKTVKDDIPEEEVGQEINDATIDLAGGKKDICGTPIILRIEGPRYHDLTLIDLPGEQTRNADLLVDSVAGGATPCSEPNPMSTDIAIDCTTPPPTPPPPAGSSQTGKHSCMVPPLCHRRQILPLGRHRPRTLVVPPISNAVNSETWLLPEDILEI